MPRDAGRDPCGKTLATSPALSGSITGFRSVCATLRKCCLSAGSLSPMRPSADGAQNMTVPGAFAEDHLPAVMSGISTRLQFGSTAGSADCGGPSTKTAILDEIVQNRRNTKAARRLLMRLLKKQGMVPRRMITDKLRSYGAAKRQDMPGVEHRSHKGLNNRAENSHVPFRKRDECAPRLSFNRKFAAFRFAVLRRSQSLRSRSHKTFRQPNSQSQTASHGSVESRQWPIRLKLSARALTRRSFEQGDSAVSSGIMEDCLNEMSPRSRTRDCRILGTNQNLPLPVLYSAGSAVAVPFR